MAVAAESMDVLADLKSSFSVPIAPKTKRYHVGIFEQNPPAWFIPIAGVTFQVTSSTFDAEEREIRRAGSFVDLTVDQVKKVKAQLEKLVVRWRRQPKTNRVIEATIHDASIANFRPEVGDEPLARYVYFRQAPPETEQPKLAENTLAMLDEAIRQAEESEERANQSPEDARTREVHGAAKRAGKRVGDDAGI